MTKIAGSKSLEPANRKPKAKKILIGDVPQWIEFKSGFPSLKNGRPGPLDELKSRRTADTNRPGTAREIGEVMHKSGGRQRRLGAVFASRVLAEE